MRVDKNHDISTLFPSTNSTNSHKFTSKHIRGWRLNRKYALQQKKVREWLCRENHLELKLKLTITRCPGNSSYDMWIGRVWTCSRQGGSHRSKTAVYSHISKQAISRIRQNSPGLSSWILETCGNGIVLSQLQHVDCFTRNLSRGSICQTGIS